MFALTTGHISAAPFGTNNVSLPELPRAGGQAGTLLPTRLKTPPKKDSELQGRESGTKTGVYSYFVPRQMAAEGAEHLLGTKVHQGLDSASRRWRPGAGFSAQIDSINPDTKGTTFSRSLSLLCALPSSPVVPVAAEAAPAPRLGSATAVDTRPVGSLGLL